MPHTSPATIVIIVAMPIERVQLEPYLPKLTSITEVPRPTYQTQLGETSIVVLQCGIGMVKAAAATEYAVLTWQPDIIMNFGCAGSHDRELLPGDVVIGSRTVNQGRLRFLADGTIFSLDGHDAEILPGEEDTRKAFFSDPTLVEMARNAASSMVIPSWPTTMDRPVRVTTGTVASADIWLQLPERIDAVSKATGSLCEDMEAAAIAQIAELHGIPFLTVKDISNNEFHAVTDFTLEFALNESEVGKRAATVIADVLNTLCAAH